ncbi:MAG: ectonucleotide pyrophosphatase/phosphodiesterase [Mangrovibacterium sp.]
MKASKLVFLLMFSILFSCKSQKHAPAQQSTPYLVVLSADGFRWDYPQLYRTPAIDDMEACGITASSLQPCFPSKTYPNHYSIATGLYPGNHGIISNSFGDSILGKFSLSNREAVENAAFYGGEPIWVTAEKQGIRSACFFWPGSEAPIKGIYPSKWKAYDENYPFEARVDSVISWLQLPQSNRPHLIMWYLHQPDHAGHHSGPDGKETEMQVHYVDSVINDFRTKAACLPICDSINFIVLSDHGMSAITKEHSVALSDYLNPDQLVDVYGGNPVFLIDAKEEYYNQVWNDLQRMNHVKCYKKGELPAHYQYKQNNRLFDFMCEADSAWALHAEPKNFVDGGTHGYDPQNKDMHAIFYAVGPAFEQNKEIPTFEVIHLYSLFAKLLGIEPAPTDGNLKPFQDGLKTKENF